MKKVMVIPEGMCLTTLPWKPAIFLRAAMMSPAVQLHAR
jgi:hypothetical protein